MPASQIGLKPTPDRSGSQEIVGTVALMDNIVRIPLHDFIPTSLQVR